jgi:triacylglycerol lipase
LGQRQHGEEEKPESTSASAVTAESVVAAAKAEASHFASARSSSAFSFSSLPSSFSTFLLGMFDSPAYANLTTRYLTKIFNPRTPDDPRVRYFSVAGRTGSLNIWHPLWLPKVVLDGANGGGNDGLVSVESARWGEFLGTLEGADHWAVRGASGIELLDADLASVVGSRDAWGLADWGRFVRALGRVEERGHDERVQQAQGTSASVAREDRSLSPMSSSSLRPPPSPSSSSSDEGLRWSTERLSAVFDWLVQQVPIASRNGLSFAGDNKSSGGGCGAGGGTGGKKREGATRWEKKEGYGDVDGKRGDLESKRDLERVYVALARKLYEEGL